jgi:hypothetical protein
MICSHCKRDIKLAIVSGGSSPYFNRGLGKLDLCEILFYYDFEKMEYTRTLFPPVKEDLPFDLDENDWKEIIKCAQGSKKICPFCLHQIEEVISPAIGNDLGIIGISPSIDKES